MRLHTKRLEGARDLAALAPNLDPRSVCWFDSGVGHPGLGDQSVLCEASQTSFALGRSCRRRDADVRALQRMRAAFRRTRPAAWATREAPPELFLGGWVGYLSYEAQVDIDPAFPGRDVDLPYPRAWFRVAHRGVTVSHRHDATWLWVWSESQSPPDLLERWATQLEGPRVPPQPLGSTAWTVDPIDIDGQWHADAVTSILERIGSGEIYQANLTAPVAVTPGRDPLALHQHLRAASPGDYAVYLRWPDLAVVASSPEQFFALSSGVARSRPMKGTRKRVGDPEEDARLAAELAASEKDRAENLMIVDLVRNDMGRVARVGSVQVPERFTVERYATVHQMTSTVVAELADGEDAFSLLGALFPPGSMTGTPKVQATRVIRELEDWPRGLYSGCVGFVSWSGDAVFNVVIRTVVSHPGGATWSVGGGIVADSTPEAELAEAIHKLRALSELPR